MLRAMFTFFYLSININVTRILVQKKKFAYHYIMKYELETIPVWDSFEKNTECPLCFLYKKVEKGFIQFFLGGSVMQPHIRGKVNKLGFCPQHLNMLYTGGNKLGLALMTHTNIKYCIKILEDMEKKMLPNKWETIPSNKFKKGIAREQLNKYISLLKSFSPTCYCCEKLKIALRHYAYTIVHLWKKEPQFKKMLSNSKGFCFSHTGDIMEMVVEVLSGKEKNSFLLEFIKLQKNNTLRLEHDILWYIQKFDHKNKDKPWKNSKDALPRTIQKLSGNEFK